MSFEKFLGQFGIKQTVDVVKLGRSFFKCDDKTLIANRPLFAGECIAHERGPAIIPSIDWLQEIGRAARRHVVVDSKGEWLFICGRDVFGKSIKSHNNPKLNDFVVVLNEHKECLGYGVMSAPIETKRVVIKRLFDIGDLLRRERRAKRRVQY